MDLDPFSGLAQFLVDGAWILHARRPNDRVPVGQENIAISLPVTPLCPGTHLAVMMLPCSYSLYASSIILAAMSCLGPGASD